MNLLIQERPVLGKGDELTLKVLNKLKLRGIWLNLAAGDGRYNLNLLEKADFVVASDIDESALDKLKQNTPDKYKSKLRTEVFDITQKFPFDNASFDGVFCTGTLHLFPKEISRQIISEIDRVLKPNGRVVIDFATDIKRTSPSGKSKKFNDEPNYKLGPAKKFLKNSFKNYKIKTYESTFVDDLTEILGYGYKASGNFILLVADKH